MEKQKDKLGLVIICSILAGTRLEVIFLDCVETSGWDWLILTSSGLLVIGGLTELIEKE